MNFFFQIYNYFLDTTIIFFVFGQNKNVPVRSFFSTIWNEISDPHRDRDTSQRRNAISGQHGPDAGPKILPSCPY